MMSFKDVAKSLKLTVVGEKSQVERNKEVAIPGF